MREQPKDREHIRVGSAVQFEILLYICSRITKIIIEGHPLILHNAKNTSLYHSKDYLAVPILEHGL